MIRRAVGALRRLSEIDAALAFFLLFGAAALAGEPFRQLKAREIVSRFVGHEFTDEVHWAHVFEKGGSLASVSMGRKGRGTWRIEDDHLCLAPETFPERCFEVWVAGQRAQLRELGIDIYEEGILQRPQKRE